MNNKKKIISELFEKNNTQKEKKKKKRKNVQTHMHAWWGRTNGRMDRPELVRIWVANKVVLKHVPFASQVIQAKAR